MEADLGVSSPNPDIDIAFMLLTDTDLPLLSPLPNHDSFEAPLEDRGDPPFPFQKQSLLEQGGTRLPNPNDVPICSQHANKETEVRSPDLDPTDPDHQAVEMLRKMSKAKDCPIENENLSLHPSLIPAGTAAGYSLLPGKVFASDEFDLLEKDTLARGSWKKYRGGLGWGIKDTCGFTYIAFKRTFELYSENCKTNWVMDVYALIEMHGSFVSKPSTKYLCHVFQSNNYDPRPRHRPPPAHVAHLVCQKSQEEAIPSHINGRNFLYWEDSNTKWDEKCDANAARPSTRIARESCDPNTAGPSTGIVSENCHLNSAGPSTRIPCGKKRKTVVWDNFTEVSVSSGPAGKVLALCICNGCGMAYRKTSGTGTLAKHKCNNH